MADLLQAASEICGKEGAATLFLVLGLGGRASRSLLRISVDSWSVARLRCRLGLSGGFGSSRSLGGLFSRLRWLGFLGSALGCWRLGLVLGPEHVKEVLPLGLGSRGLLRLFFLDLLGSSNWSSGFRRLALRLVLSLWGLLLYRGSGRLGGFLLLGRALALEEVGDDF